MAENDDRVVELLEQLVTWTKAGLYESVESLVDREFADARPEQRLAYQLSDSQIQTEIVRICKEVVGDEATISQSAVSDWHSRWERVGLISRSGRTVTRHFSLEDFGLDVPDVDSSVLEDD